MVSFILVCLILIILDTIFIILFATSCIKIPGIVDGIEHTFGFTPTTLRLCLQKTGFEVRKIRTFGKGETPSSLLKTLLERGFRKASVAFFLKYCSYKNGLYCDKNCYTPDS